jgi:hypothetical protein
MISGKVYLNFLSVTHKTLGFASHLNLQNEKEYKTNKITGKIKVKSRNAKAH